MKRESPLRVLFLCWGYSIHAERRVRLFIDDPRFQVCVVSTYDYRFADAENVLLEAARKQPSLSTHRPGAFAKLIPLAARTWLRKLARLACLPLELRTMSRDLRTLRDAVSRFRPDLVFLQTLQYPAFLAYGLPSDQLMMVTFWNGDLTHFAKWSGVEMLAKRALVRHGLRRVNAITVNSQAAFDAAVEQGADPQKLTLLRYPGADLALFHPRDRAAAREKLGIGARHVVFCPRGLGAFFDSDVIVQAAAQVIKKQPDVLFLFVSGVGGQEQWRRHVALAARLGVGEGNLRWDGQVPWRDMPWYYAASDMMVSIMRADSCPNCMLEAMACAVPVVMSDTRQNREWIDDQRNGFLCPPRDPGALADRILRLLSEPPIGQRFAAICLETVRSRADSAVNVEKIKRLALMLARKQVGDDVQALRTR